MSLKTCQAFRRAFEKYGYREMTFDEIGEEACRTMSPLTFRKYVDHVTVKKSKRPSPESGNIHTVYLYHFKRNLTVKPHGEDRPFAITN